MKKIDIITKDKDTLYYYNIKEERSVDDFKANLRVYLREWSIYLLLLIKELNEKEVQKDDVIDYQSMIEEKMVRFHPEVLDFSFEGIDVKPLHSNLYLFYSTIKSVFSEGSTEESRSRQLKELYQPTLEILNYLKIDPNIDSNGYIEDHCDESFME